METEKEIKTTKQLVRELLEEDEYTRKSDTYLILEVLRIHGFDIAISYKDLENLPSFETITRVRRALQKEYPNLKDEVTADLREKRETQFKHYFGKNI